MTLKMVSASVFHLLHQPIDEKINTWTLRFPAKNPNNYIDLARVKSEALVNNTCKQKNLNLVMLNGDDNENGFKTNRSN